MKKEIYPGIAFYKDNALLSFAIGNFERSKMESSKDPLQQIDQLQESANNAAHAISKRARIKFASWSTQYADHLSRFNEDEQWEINKIYHSLEQRRRRGQTSRVNQLYKAGHLSVDDVSPSDGTFRKDRLEKNEFFQDKENEPLLDLLTNYHVNSRSTLGKEVAAAHPPNPNPAHIPIVDRYLQMTTPPSPATTAHTSDSIDQEYIDTMITSNETGKPGEKSASQSQRRRPFISSLKRRLPLTLVALSMIAGLAASGEIRI